MNLGGIVILLSRNGLPDVNSKQDNVNVHRAAAKIIVFKSRAARGSVCNDRFETAFEV